MNRSNSRFQPWGFCFAKHIQESKDGRSLKGIGENCRTNNPLKWGWQGVHLHLWR
jgi:hypothetical protein